MDPLARPAHLQPCARTFVRWGRRRFSFFSGCDYFRLSSHPRVLAAAARGLERFGLTVSASRTTTGNHRVYGELEEALADFFQADAVLLTSTGYSAPLVAAQALAGEATALLLDERAHLALRDAVAALGRPVTCFGHRSAEDLGSKLARLPPQARPLVMTDGLFAHDGSVAPLREYLKILPRTGRILVDDAHGAGIIGVRGRGALEEAGVSRARIVQTITLSKAFGTFGGAVLGSSALRRAATRAPAFVGATPPPLPLAVAALAAVRLLRRDGALLRRLRENRAYLNGRLGAPPSEDAVACGPILPVGITSPRAAKAFCDELRRRTIFPSLLRYPGGPPEGYFRFVLSSEHTRAQLDTLAEALAFARAKGWVRLSLR